MFDLHEECETDNIEKVQSSVSSYADIEAKTNYVSKNEHSFLT